MTEEEFIEAMVDLMDTEMEITMDTVLTDVEEWDSLSYVAFQAMASVKLAKKLIPQQVRNAKTIRDLYVLIQ